MLHTQRGASTQEGKALLLLLLLLLLLTAMELSLGGISVQYASRSAKETQNFCKLIGTHHLVVYTDDSNRMEA